MKCFAYSAVVIALMLLGSCKTNDIYKQNLKTLDSLSGAINSMLNEFSKLDTVILQKSIARFSYYKQFIQQNVNDTVSKNDADNLQQFYASGNNLQNFLNNKKNILARGALINSQIRKLSLDTKNTSIDSEQLSKYTIQEKSETEKLMNLSYEQQKLYHTALEEFKISLRGIELLIRSHNNGELPTIIKDTLNL
jgi:hypothetical protein